MTLLRSFVVDVSGGSYPHAVEDGKYHHDEGKYCDG